MIIYTGGTIGMVGKPLEPGPLEELKKNIPEADKLPYSITWRELKYGGEFIDSSNVDYKFMNELAGTIGRNHDKYDGFVVIMGTDTMADTSAMTSYLLEGLKKPVVFTGSMGPAQSEEFQEKDNLLNAINIAARSGYDIPLINESVICFNHKIIRGVWANKFRAQGPDAFDLPGANPYPLLGKIEQNDILINKDLLLPVNDREFKINRIDESISISLEDLAAGNIGSPEIFTKVLKDKTNASNAILFYNLTLNATSEILQQ